MYKYIAIFSLVSVSFFAGYSFNRSEVHSLDSRLESKPSLHVESKLLTCNDLVPVSKQVVRTEKTDSTKEIPAKVAGSVEDTQDTDVYPSLTVVEDLIEMSPDFLIESELGKYIRSEELGVISDKRVFAKRLAEEYFDETIDSPRPELGANLALHVSASSNHLDPPDSDFYLSDDKRFIVYAHLVTDGYSSNSGNIFIKWSNTTTGDVLLFERKGINSNSESNWVSYKPRYQWSPGEYKVKVYQFGSELALLAESFFYIYEDLTVSSY